MRQEGLLAELDTTKIPNAKLLGKHLQHLPFDPEQRHSVPYLWERSALVMDHRSLPLLRRAGPCSGIPGMPAESAC